MYRKQLGALAASRHAIFLGCVFLSISSLNPLHAQTGSEAPQPASKTSSSGIGASFGSFFGKIGQTLSGNRETFQIDDLRPGVYQKSNEAIGDSKDIDEKRITHGLLVLPSFTQYANGVLTQLKAASKLEQIPGEVLVAANDQLDAGATADGNIYISSGYIRELKSEDELAALLAHELSHVLLRHHDSSAFGRMQKQLSTVLLYGATIRNTLDKATGGASGNALTPGQKDALQKLELLIKLNDIALHPAWGRRQEAEADRLGMDLMVKAGYSYNGLLNWLAIVEEWDKKQAESKAKDVQMKQESMNALMANGKFDETLKQGLDVAFQGIVTELSRSHEDGAKRVDDINNYYIKVYKETVPNVALKTAPWKQVKEKPDVRQVMDGYQAVFVARNAVREGRFDEAIKKLSPLVDRKTAVSNEAMPNQLMFEAYRGKGRSKEAERYLRKSFDSSNPVWDVYDSAAVFFRDKGDMNEVMKVGEFAFKRFSGAPSAYPKLISLYRANGLDKARDAVLADCMLKQADRRDQCVDAAKAK